jgi:hypothetical protein
MKVMNRKIGFVSLVLAIVLVSCNKTDSLLEGLSEKSATIVQNDIIVENAEAEVCYEADYYANIEKSLSLQAGKGQRWNWMNILRYKINQCPNVTIDSAKNGYPKTITLNYGNGVELKNGRVLSGVITINITAPRLTDGAKRTFTFNNYSVDDVAVSGTLVTQFNGDNQTTRIHTQTGDLEFTLPDGKTINRDVNRVVEWLEGLDTPEDMTDDKVQITAAVDVAVSDGGTYHKETAEPLIKLGDCRWFVQGVVDIEINGETTISIDYGDGECDNLAIVTKDGVTNEVDLSDRHPRVMKRLRKG